MTDLSGAQTIEIDTNGVVLKAVAMGEGPLVVLLHGFPESWYSWRHQMPALATAGYRVVALQQRGYTGSSAPDDVAAYDTVELAADVAGAIAALGEDSAFVIGHDWGCNVAWHIAWLHPERVRAVAGISVPWVGRPDAPVLDLLDQIFAGRFFYMRYFQQPGRAEADLEQDVPASLRRLIDYFGAGAEKYFQQADDGRGIGDRVADVPLPGWMSETEFIHYVEEFEQSGFRGPLNWYRNFTRTWERTAGKGPGVITRPAMFMAGESDPVIGMLPGMIDIMRQLIPDLQKVEIVPGTHWLPMEDPETVNRSLVAFLDANR